MGLACTKEPRVVGGDGGGGGGGGRRRNEADTFSSRYSLEDSKSLHALSVTTSKNEEDSLVQEVVQRSVSFAGSEQDEAVNQLFQLIEAGVSLNMVDEHGETPIFAVARAGRLVMMEQLLSNGASATVVNWHGSTPMHEAAGHGHSECVASLIEHSVSLVAVRDREGNTPLHLAAAAGHGRCVKLLLEAGSQYDTAVGALNNQGLAPVHLAAKNGRLGVLEEFYKFEQAWGIHAREPTMVTARDATGKTALMHAAIESHDDVVQMLLMRGADPNVSDAEGKTSGHHAVIAGAITSLMSILECGGDPDIKDSAGLTPFCYCAMSENPGPLEGMIAEALMYSSIESGDVEVVKAAIAQIHHCSPLEPTRLKDFGGNLPIHAACRRGVVDLVRLLASEGQPEDLRVRNDAGDMPIHVACRVGMVECVEALLSMNTALGADTTSTGDTCLHIAAKSGHTELVTLLTATFHLEPEARNVQGQTPLHEAVCAMRYGPVKALLAAGADALAKDASGATSIDLSGEGGLFQDSDIHRLLVAMVEHGVVEDVLGVVSPLEDLIELSDDDMAMLEEMGSIDFWSGGDSSTIAGTMEEAPEVPSETGARADADVVQKTVRLPSPVAASPFGALGDSSAGRTKGFQKFASSIKRTSDTGALEAAKSLYIKPEAIDVYRNHVLGEGSFGIVYLGVLDGNKVAIKVFKRLAPSLSFKEDKNRERQQFLDELDAMADLRHDNIQAIRGYCILPEGRAIVSAYYDRGSLVNLLAKGTRDPAAARELSWGRRLRMAIDISKAMMGMHNRQPPRVHRDLKAANCFVDTNWNAYLGDFGFASRTGDSCDMWSKTGPTNPRWLSPEVLVNSAYSESSDVYAFGMLMYELLTWRAPYGRERTAAIFNLVAAGVRPAVPEVSDLPGDPEDNRVFAESGALDMYINIMRSCWEQSPRTRVSTNEVYGELLAIVRAMRRVNC